MFMDEKHYIPHLASQEERKTAKTVERYNNESREPRTHSGKIQCTLCWFTWSNSESLFEYNNCGVLLTVEWTILPHQSSPLLLDGEGELRHDEAIILSYCHLYQERLQFINLYFMDVML